MPVVEWNESFSVGHGELDAQHQRLFKAINDLYDATRGRRSPEDIRRAMGFLMDYTRTHFADEEAIMADRRYPDLAAHRAEHQELISSLEEFCRRLAKEKTDPFLQDDLVHFLTGAWLIEHVMTTDQKYAAVL